MRSNSIDMSREEIYISGMDYNEDKVDELVLALLHLTSSRSHGIVRAWKGHDWDALDRLHRKGLIGDPKSKSKSVVLSEDGARAAQELFERFCGS
ncbi:MAG TPA: DUF6429 family protein [Pyrinomonadaceae bacterium]|nr:DUF6429 family protein [Pyrinomonadaceae bacterium]